MDGKVGQTDRDSAIMALPSTPLGDRSSQSS